MSSLARTLSSPFNSKVVQGARKFMSLQASNAQKALTSEFHELFKERTVTRKRKKIVNEIIESEKSYQNHVSLLISLYLVPIKVGSILPRKAIEAIFGNIEAIHSVNVQLLDLMETEDVATALYQLAPFMKLYSLYANNFELSNKTIEEYIKKNPEFASFKELQESREEMGGLKLRALLITPIQRIPRYKLLLESLLEKTVPEHPDYQKLRDACAEVSKVATHINECLRQHENFNRMLGIQNSFIGDGAPKILAPGRKFLREGILSKVCDRGGSKERMFFLFNDMLIYSKKEAAGTYICRGVFPLINCMVEQVMGGTRGPSDGGALFKISCKGKTLLLYSTSQHNARSWLRDIKDAIIELHSNLASLRRGENDPFTPPDAALRRDSKLRRSKALKELSKKKNPLSPMQVLSSCVSPRQDSLYPMRNDILPQLANNVNKESFLLQKNEPTIFTACLSSVKRERHAKPTLRRLQMEDSLLGAEKGGKESYSLRSRKRKCGDDKVENDDVFVERPGRFESAKRLDKRNSQRRLISDMDQNDKQNASPGCFGSAKKSRVIKDIRSKMQERKPMEETCQEQGSFINMAVDDTEEEEEHYKPDVEASANEVEKECDKIPNQLEIETQARATGLTKSKVWSLVDDTGNEGERGRLRRSFHGKTKVSRSRRKKRNISTRRPYGMSRSTSDSDHQETNDNSDLLCGKQGTFKYTHTPTAAPGTQTKDSVDNQSSCVVM